MKGFNQVNLIGNLTRDPESKSLTNGTSVVNFSLAINGYEDRVDYFDIVCFGKLADVVSTFVKKGSKIHVSGRLQQQTWEKDGQKRSKVEIVASDVIFLDAKEQKTDVVPVDIPGGEIDMSKIPF